MARIALDAMGGDFAPQATVAGALAVLVVATPCPLILAVPIALVSGVSVAARRGLIVKGAAPLEQLAVASSVVFDKTGTLTRGELGVVDLEPLSELQPQRALALAAAVARRG